MPELFELKFYRGKFYGCRTIDGKTERRSLRSDERTEALRNLAALNEYLIPSFSATSISQVYAEYFEARKNIVIDPDRIEYSWNHLKPFFGDFQVGDIDEALCKDYITHRREQWAADGTIIKELNTLKAMIRRVDKNLPQSFVVPSHPSPKSRFLSPEEYQALLRAMTANHLILFTELALGTAGRATAILELTWSRVNLESGEINLKSIDGDNRQKGRAKVSINDHLQSVLTEAKKRATSPYVVAYAGRPVKSIKKSFKAAAKRAGLEGVTPHTLRHTAAVWMARKDIRLSQIAEFLGHKDVSTTFKIYAEHTPAGLKKAANAVDPTKQLDDENE